MSYVRVSILGTLVGGEVWSINPVFDPTGEFPGGVDQVALDAATAAIAAIAPGINLLNLLSVAGTVTGARLEVRDDATDGLIGISQVNRVTPIPGSGTATKPAQISIVYSLRTNTPGASGRGRVYWPALGRTIGTDLRFATADVTNSLDDMKLYLAAMRTALAAAFPTIGFNLAVRSRTKHQTPHVVRMQAGNVPDTQRRRRDSLPESYQTTNIP